MARKSTGNIQMTGSSVLAPTLPAMGTTRLERMEAGLQMLKDWQADCAAINACSESAFGHTMHQIFHNIGRNIDLAVSNLAGVVRTEREMNPPKVKKEKKLTKGRHRRKFLKRPIVPPHYNGVLIDVATMMEHRQVSREMVYKDMRTGRLPQTYRWGRKVVWLLSDLEKCMRVPVAWKRKEIMR